MLDQPRIIQTSAQAAAVIRLTVPRDEIRQVMGPAIHEVISAVSAQGVGPVGPVFSHHFRNDPAVFDFEVGVPVSAPVRPVGRVQAGELPAAKVARAVYSGPYEGLAQAWGEFSAWNEAQGYGRVASFWERYVIGPESGLDPAKWETELNRVLSP